MFFLFKALHIVGFVSWFAGMFYLVRMFVYHAEALDKSEPEKSILCKQLSLMENRVYKIICKPAMNITWIFGIAMLVNHGLEWLKLSNWMHVKLGLIVLLTVYHERNKVIIKKLEQGNKPMSSDKFRLYNEIPTLFLVSIVMIAVYKNTLNYVYLILGILLFGILLILATKFYKKIRNKEV